MKKKFLFWIAVIIAILAVVVIGYNKLNNKENNEDVNIYDENVVDIYEESEQENIEEVVEIEEEKVPVSYSAAVPIYMYHWIRDDVGDYPWPENMVRPAKLEEQVKYLVDNKFDLIWITDLEKIYNYEKPVALTFDDGWLDVYLYMFPLAKQYNIKFSMYVIKDMIGDPGYCDAAQLREMAESGLVDIQSHTISHPYLATLSYDRQRSELFDSKTFLKETFDIDSTVICYPYGSRNDYTVQLSKEAGYVYGLDMDGGIYYTDKHTDPLKIPRIYATRSMTIDTFSWYANQAKVNVVWE